MLATARDSDSGKRQTLKSCPELLHPSKPASGLRHKRPGQVQDCVGRPTQTLRRRCCPALFYVKAIQFSAIFLLMKPLRYSILGSKKKTLRCRRPNVSRMTTSIYQVHRKGNHSAPALPPEGQIWMGAGRALSGFTANRLEPGSEVRCQSRLPDNCCQAIVRERTHLDLLLHDERDFKSWRAI